MRRLRRILGNFYDWLNDRQDGLLPEWVKRNLVCLHPSADKETLYRNYMVDKMVRSLLVGGAAILLGIALGVQAEQNRSLGEHPAVTRNGYADGEKEVELIAHWEDVEEQVTIQVAEEQLTDGEAQTLYEEFVVRLPTLILGENPSLQEVTQNLRLEEGYDGYPFTVEWSSSRGDFLSGSGRVYPPEEGAEEVVLTVTIAYGDKEWSTEMNVTIVSPALNEDELRQKRLQELLEASERESREETDWRLPTEWQGSAIAWTQKVDDYSRLVMVAGIVVAVLLFFCSDRDLQQEVEQRRMQMKGDYPDIVYKLLLYMGAGMTMRGAFRKIAEEYEAVREQNTKAAYEEILYMVHELESGVSESAAYVNWGKRIGVQEYIRLGTLLTQNLKRGNATLLLRLREEVDRASVERLQVGKKRAEEAVTKLLVPMVMMLAVVMVMVMMPAFTSIQ